MFKKGVSGNPGGRPKGTVSLTTELIHAVELVEKEKKISVFKHFVLRALENDQVLIALIKKFVPDKLQGEGFANSGVYVYIVKDGKLAGGGDHNRIALHTASESAYHTG